MTLTDWTLARRRDGDLEIRRGTLLYAIIHRDEEGYRFQSVVRRRARKAATAWPTLREAIRRSKQFTPQLTDYLLGKFERGEGAAPAGKGAPP